ncbi:hypothetical protein KHQ82_10140 [Mycoplasmatota bacterium]|nr:hypothetical protein KHQ82_10140 [Mycoplasmatota bacterium]
MKKIFLVIIVMISSIILFGCKEDSYQYNDESSNQLNGEADEQSNVDTTENKDEKVSEYNFDNECGIFVCAFSEYSIYDQGVLAIDVMWINNSSSDLGPGDDYTLQKKETGTWRTLEDETFKGSTGVISFIEPGESEIYRYSLFEYTDEIAEGEYRILTDYLGMGSQDMKIPFSINDQGEVDISLDNQQKYWYTSEQRYDDIDGLTMEIEEELYNEFTKISAKLVNNIDDKFTYGLYFALEKKVDGVWKTVVKDINFEGAAFNLIGFTLLEIETVEVTYNLGIYSYGLNAGEYRIATTILRETLDGQDYGPGNYPQYQVYGYFEIR